MALCFHNLSSRAQVESSGITWPFYPLQSPYAISLLTPPSNHHRDKLTRFLWSQCSSVAFLFIAPATLSASAVSKWPAQAFPQTAGGHTAHMQGCTKRWPGAVLQGGDMCLVPCCPSAIPGAQHPHNHFWDCFSLLGQFQPKDGWFSWLSLALPFS